MGGCCCKADGAGLSLPVVIPGGREAVAAVKSSDKAPWWARRARLELGNDTTYRVSYWVLREDQVKTKEINERLLETIEGSLNDTTAAAAASSVIITDGTAAKEVGVAEQRAKEFVKEQAEVPRFLLRDHRIDTTGGLPMTVVRILETMHE